MAKRFRWDFRDVSKGIQKLREFLLGRKYVFHNRFPPLISPRSIPPPDIPRGPEHKYSDQWYGHRNVLASVKPPVVGPIAEGRPRKVSAKQAYPCGEKSEDAVKFMCPPTPGMPWWWDGHCYYVTVPDQYNPQARPPKTTPPEKPCQPPCPPERPQPAAEVSGPCDPCNPPNKKTC